MAIDSGNEIFTQSWAAVASTHARPDEEYLRRDNKQRDFNARKEALSFAQRQYSDLNILTIKALLEKADKIYKWLINESD